MREMLCTIYCAAILMLTGLPGIGGTAGIVGISRLLAGPPPSPGENIALGCKVIFAKTPDYPSTVDPSDAAKLTDGKYANEVPAMWQQKDRTVGWKAHGENYPSFIIDLGKELPISGASYSTASRYDMPWPVALLVMASNDMKTWSYAGDLIGSSNGQSLPPTQRYTSHRFVSSSLRLHARYVKVVVLTLGSAFCDEFEIYLGSDSQLDSTYPVSSTKSFIQGFLTHRSVINTIRGDLSTTSAALQASTLKPDQKAVLHEKLNGIDSMLDLLPTPDLASFKAIVPYNRLHMDVLSIYGTVMHAKGLPEISIWKKNRYDLVSYMDVSPRPTTAPSIRIDMMKNEYRADALLLSNTSGSSSDLEVRIVGLPGVPNPPWLRIFDVPWTATSTPTVVAAAFADARYIDGYFRISVPAGMTKKVWFEVDSSRLSPGDYDSYMDIGSFHVPFSIHISGITLQHPRLSLGMWDYAFGQGRYPLTPLNIPPAIESMRSHFLDSPWGRASFLQDIRNNFDDFDAWIKRWPEAHNYLAVAGAPATFAGAPIGSPKFEQAVKSQLGKFASHLADLGIPEDRVILLLVDEPHTPSQYERNLAWARSIKTYSPRLRLFIDIVLTNLSDSKLKQILQYSDILSPHLRVYYAGGSTLAKHYASLVQSGKALWFYQTGGPAKVLDPYVYYRLMAWHAFRNGATGIGFWSFSDTGGAVSSWNECSIYAGKSYTPVFIDGDTVTDGIHWEAVREGIEDYEYLAMLNDAALHTSRPELKTEAFNLIADAMDGVLGTYNGKYTWRSDVNHEQADNYRLRILALLEKMRLGSNRGYPRH